MRQKPNLLIFDLVFKLNLGQSQQQSQFRDMKILVCSNSYNVFGFQMSIKDYCQLKARLKSHNILGELYLILKNKRQTPQKTLHLISSLSSYPRTNQCYGTGVKVHNVWVTKCLYTQLKNTMKPHGNLFPCLQTRQTHKWVNEQKYCTDQQRVFPLAICGWYSQREL